MLSCIEPPQLMLSSHFLYVEDEQNLFSITVPNVESFCRGRVGWCYMYCPGALGYVQQRNLLQDW